MPTCIERLTESLNFIDTLRRQVFWSLGTLRKLRLGKIKSLSQDSLVCDGSFSAKACSFQ